MNDPLREAEGRLQRYWNVDGLHEIGIAVLLGLTALWVWVSDLSDLPRAWKGAFSATFPVLICGGIYGEKYLVNAIRRRLTYPRAGFAEMRKPPRIRQVWAAVVAVIFAVAIARFAVVRHAIDQWFVTFLGVMVGIFLWQVGTRSGLPRFRMVGAFLAVLAIAMGGAGWEFHIALVSFFAMAAAALFISGGITLRRFLHA